LVQRAPSGPVLARLLHIAVQWLHCSVLQRQVLVATRKKFVVFSPLGGISAGW
jgi:hypothetical protein